MRKTLYSRLQPDVKARLEENHPRYEFTINRLIAKLDSKIFWSELTINDISDLVVFSDSDMTYTRSNVMHGDISLIQEENQVI
jgi:hypothetical protein